MNSIQLALLAWSACLSDGVCFGRRKKKPKFFVGREGKEDMHFFVVGLFCEKKDLKRKNGTAYSSCIFGIGLERS